MRTAKASPFGRGVTEGDGEGKPGRKEPLRSDGQALCQSDAIAVPELFVSGLALSVSSQAPRQLPQRGSPWHVGQLSSGRAKHNISEAAVLRCLGQRQLDKERCPEAAVPVSKARPFASCRASGVQWKVIRPAKASPFGRGVTEGDGEGKPGRKEPLRSDGQALCQSDAIAVPELFVSGLALSVSSQAPRQLPQRGSHWHVGQLSSGRAKHNISEAAVLRCLGQRQLDKERCPEAAVPVSKARPLASCRASVVQWKVTRPAKGSPSGGAVTPAA